MDDWPEMYVNFQSFKRGRKSIAYVAHPVVVYEPTYSVYKTHADSKRGKITKMQASCPIQAQIGFYYEHNKQNEVRYLGNAYDLSEVIEKEPEAPKYGVLINDQPVTEETAALILFAELKASEETDDDVDVCYFGEWEKAVDSTHRSISIGVLDIYSGGELEVEIRNTNTKEYTYGLIRGC